MALEEEEKIAKTFFDCVIKFYKSRDPKDLEPLKQIVLTHGGHIGIGNFEIDISSPEEMIRRTELLMRDNIPFIVEQRMIFRKQFGKQLKEKVKEYMKTNPITYHVPIMENKAIRVIEIPDTELENVLEYWALMEMFYETKDLEFLVRITHKYFVDTNGDLHFPEENPFFILINYDKLKSEIEKFSV